MTAYFDVNAAIELASLQITLKKSKLHGKFEEECLRLTELLLKKEARIKEIMESS